MKKYMALALAVIMLICTGCRGNKNTAFDIKVVVPAGNQGEFVFSNEEISPLEDSITITPQEGFDNVEFALDTVEGNTKASYPPTSLTTGTSIERGVEKGAWYRLGIKADNPTDEDMTLYIRVESVEVRIE